MGSNGYMKKLRFPFKNMAYFINTFTIIQWLYEFFGLIIWWLLLCIFISLDLKLGILYGSCFWIVNELLERIDNEIFQQKWKILVIIKELHNFIMYVKIRLINIRFDLINQ